MFERRSSVPFRTRTTRHTNRRRRLRATLAGFHSIICDFIEHEAGRFGTRHIDVIVGPQLSAHHPRQPTSRLIINFQPLGSGLVVVVERSGGHV